MDFQPDCQNCAALCCVALAFDRSNQFPINKPAGTPCPDLTPDGRCSIHDQRETHGYKGCTTYNCLGAGQRVTMEVFSGQSWQRDLAILPLMSDAFHVMLRIQEWRELLAEAGKLPLDQVHHKEWSSLNDLLNPSCGWTEQALENFSANNVAAKVKSFLASLKKYKTVRNSNTNLV